MYDVGKRKAVEDIEGETSSKRLHLNEGKVFSHIIIIGYTPYTVNVIPDQLFNTDHDKLFHTCICMHAPAASGKALAEYCMTSSQLINISQSDWSTGGQ